MTFQFVSPCDDPASVEKYWHRHFADFHVKGEWYDLSQKQLDHIKRATDDHYKNGTLTHEMMEIQKEVELRREKRSIAAKPELTTQPPKATKENVRDILQKHRAKLLGLDHDGARSFLDKEEFDVVHKALQNHTRADSKIGVGVANIFVQEASGYKSKSYCFHVERLDGSEEDFSYQYCFSRAPNFTERQSHYTYKRAPPSTHGK